MTESAVDEDSLEDLAGHAGNHDEERLNAKTAQARLAFCYCGVFVSVQLAGC
jgi:hypothetical protein